MIVTEVNWSARHSNVIENILFSFASLSENMTPRVIIIFDVCISCPVDCALRFLVSCWDTISSVVSFTLSRSKLVADQLYAVCYSGSSFSAFAGLRCWTVALVLISRRGRVSELPGHALFSVNEELSPPAAWCL